MAGSIEIDELTVKESDGRFNRRALKVEEAQRLVLAAAKKEQCGSELVPLSQCGGRRLAQSLAATSDWPPFARSGLDGYAVRAADAALATPGAPALLRVAAAVAAGQLAAEPLGPGTAVRIMTGAAVPEGADAVVMLEQTADAVLAGGEAAVLIKAAAAPGQNVAPRGEEYRLGSQLAEPGALLKPGHAALFGTFGYAAVPVYKRPRVAVFATGSELLPVDAALAPGQIRDSNSAMVAAMVEQSGASPILLGALPDNPDAVAEAIARVWHDADLIITTGGVSVGDHDVMTELFRRLEHYLPESGYTGSLARGISDQKIVCASEYSSGEYDGAPASDHIPTADGVSREAAQDKTRLLFNRVSMRPGSPTSAALVGGKLLLALSGNPGACFVGFELFARPALLSMQGVQTPLPRIVRARLTADVGKGSPHPRYVRCQLHYGADGILAADMLAFNKSSMLASIADAEGLAVIPSGSTGAHAGDLIEVLLLS